MHISFHIRLILRGEIIGKLGVREVDQLASLHLKYTKSYSLVTLEYEEGQGHKALYLY